MYQFLDIWCDLPAQPSSHLMCMVEIYTKNGCLLRRKIAPWEPEKVYSEGLWVEIGY